jgi:PPOX class probable F420-dependent enzyme
MPIWTDHARQFLEARRVGHLATASATGDPHVVPVCYALDDRALYVVADLKAKRRPAHQLRRLENLQANPRATIVVDEYHDDWSRLAWVMVRGTTSLVGDPAAHAHALVLLRARYAPYRSMPLDDPLRHPIVRIEPTRVTTWQAA